MNQLQTAVSQQLTRNEYHPVIVKLLQLILSDKMNSLERDKVLHSCGIRRITDIKSHTLPVILDYAIISLEDNFLEDVEMHNIKMLKLFFGIEEGDFYKNNLQKRVEEIITIQLKRVYADGVVDTSEALQIGELQNLFGLSYDQFEAIVHQVK